MSTLAERVMEHEGFVNTIYKDTLGFATIGFGHKVTEHDHFEEGVEYSREELEKLFHQDLEHAQLLCENMFMCDLSYDPPELLKDIYTEMIFQLGPGGVSKFKKTFDFVKMKQFKNASIEMLDSRWNKQTPNRAKALSDLMATVEI
tara:strand:+ start:70 stop:507 length:438 start_codon:yes stop_codon:yes gene_type:complete